MRVLGINNNQITFKRRPTKEEEPGLKQTIDRTYEALGNKERVVITHGSCFPALGRDSYIGSPYGNAAKEYIKFLTLYGFNGNQLGPGGELEVINGEIQPSPYNSSAFAKNKLFIDLGELTKDKYGKILSEETYNSVTKLPEISNKNYDMTDFNEAFKTYNTALKESYSNFKAKVAKGQPEALALNKEFNKFIDTHDERLTDEGIFHILSRKYGTDRFEEWPDEADKNMIPNIRKGDFEAIEKYNDFVEANKNEIEQYKFEQFIATKQIKENKDWRDTQGFKYINDLLVGCSKMDRWRYQDIFLKDWEMGARESNGKSQRWFIPVIDPKKIFKNNNYELGDGGKFLKEKLAYALEFCENIRIDHAMGLIEPYILSKTASDEEFVNGGNKNHNVEKYISELRDPKNPQDEYDKNWYYPKLLEKLILPELRKKGITPDMPVWEDICSYPSRFVQIYEHQLNLPKIQNIDWNKSQKLLGEGRKNDWYLIGSHDNMPAMTYMQRIGDMKDGSKGEYTREQEPWNPDYLAGYLNMDDGRKNIGDIRNQLKELYNTNDRERVRAKFAELMTTPKFQISFADLLGITDVTYNIGGSKREENWKERISADYLDKYYENLASENPTALNIPELLKKALQAKIDMQVMAENEQNRDKTRNSLTEKYQPLLDDLQKYADILKEPVEE